MFTTALQKQKKVFHGMALREKITFRLHLIYSILDGIGLGVLALNEFVLLRNMDASTMQVSVLFQIMVFVMPFSIFFTHFLSLVKNKKRFLRLFAFITRAPLLLFIIFPNDVKTLANHQIFIYLYILIFLMYFVANPIIFPIINLFTKSNYKSQRFGRLFSYTLIITQIATLLCTYFYGRLLDWNPESYRFVLPLIGVIGFIAIYLITLIPYKERADESLLKEAKTTVGKILDKSIKILKENKAFADFQVGMMCYGAGYLMALAVITVYLSKHFLLSYTEIAFYKNIPVILSIIAFPLFGKWMDEIDPRKMAILSFFSAALFYFCLLAGGFFSGETLFRGHRIIYWVLAGYIFNGAFAASMGLVWGIGSSYFAPARKAAKYHAVHLSLTGIRGLIFPAVGVLAYQIIGFSGAFLCCVLLQIGAMMIMYRSMQRNKIS